MKRDQWFERRPRRRWGWVFFVVVALILGRGVVTPAWSDSAGADGGELSRQAVEQRLGELEQEIKILKRRLELADEQAATKAKDAPVVTAGEKGFGIQSADGSFQLKVRGYVQADGRFFVDDTSASNSFLLRRVRPIFEGTLGKDYGFRIMPDFGGGSTVLQDAYLEANYWPEARLRIGKFKSPFGLERLQSGTDILFVERASPTSLAPNRDLGIQLHGDLWGGSLSYALAVLNGVSDGGSGDSDVDDDKDAVVRLFAHPFKRSAIWSAQGLGLGVAASIGNQKGSLPSFKSSGQQTVFSYLSGAAAAGERVRISPQGYYYYGPFGLLGEYVLSSQEVRRGSRKTTIDNAAWQVAASYVLTGEDASYKGVKPEHPFDLKKGEWGAVELAARYNVLDVDSDAFPSFASAQSSVDKLKGWAVGLNWYLNRNVKYVVDYEQTEFDGGATRGDRDTEYLILNRFQVSY